MRNFSFKIVVNLLLSSFKQMLNIVEPEPESVLIKAPFKSAIFELQKLWHMFHSIF